MSVKCVCLLILMIFSCTTAKVIEGHVHASSKWSVISRFVFAEQNGQLDYSVTFPFTNPVCSPKIAFYYTDTWRNVYPHPNMECATKMTYASLSHKVDQASNTSRVICANHGNYRQCRGRISFLPMIHRWWFLVLSFCDSGVSLDVKYEFTITDGSSWERHVSAEDSHMFLFTAICLAILTIALVIGVNFGTQLAMSRFLHSPYKTFLVGLVWEECALVLETGYYLEYIKIGTQMPAVQTVGSLFHAASEILFVILLILLAKGFTVTRGRLPKLTQIKLGLFTTLYGIAYVIYYVIETRNQDAGMLRNSLDDGAEVGLIILRMVAWAWCLYGVVQTIDKYPEKCKFYCCFGVFFSVWFLVKPCITVFTRFLFDDWLVGKIIKGAHLANCIMGYVIFLHLTRPTAANRYFPFHVRTNQIDVVTTCESADFPHTEDYSKINKKEKGKLEASLTDLDKAGSETEDNKHGTVSVWFSGAHCEFDYEHDPI